MLCSDDKCPLSGKCSENVIVRHASPAKLKLKEALTTALKFDLFRPCQLETLLPVANGKDVCIHIYYVYWWWKVFVYVFVSFGTK